MSAKANITESCEVINNHCFNVHNNFRIHVGNDGDEVLYGTSDGKIGLVQLGRCVKNINTLYSNTKLQCTELVNLYKEL